MLPVYSGWDIIYGKAVFSVDQSSSRPPSLPPFSRRCRNAALPTTPLPARSSRDLSWRTSTIRFSGALGGSSTKGEEGPCLIACVIVDNLACRRRNIGCKSGHRRRHYPGFCNKSRGMDGGRQGQTQDALVQDGCREEKGRLGLPAMP